MRRIEIGEGAIGSELIWHQTECGGYSADLPLWERLASDAGGTVLDLGAGAGRVALHLAARGIPVQAVDSDRELLAAVELAAASRGLPVTTRLADVREPATEDRHRLALAPMQLMHLLGGRAGRADALRSVVEALEPGGLFAAALLDDREEIESGTVEPLPDVREREGWVHSSLPLEVRVDVGGVMVRRLRQVVSPDGELFEREHEIRLDHLPPAALEGEAAEHGFTVEPRVTLPATNEHVGSVVVMLRRNGGVPA